MPLDAQARDLVAKAEYSLTMMRRGAALARCDWGVSYEDGVFLRLPQAPAARVLSALACLRARIRFEEGQSAEAVDDVLAAMTLGRHVSREGGLVILLFAYQIEHRAIETLAQHLPMLNADTIKNLQSRLAALPPFASQATALISCEEQTLDWFIRQVKGAKDKDSLLASFAWIGISEGKGGNTAEGARAFLKECGDTAEGVVKFAMEAKPSYALLAKKIDLPLDEFQMEFQCEAMAKSGNPVFRVFFPALPKCRQSQARVDIRRAQLSAALAVQLEGKKALKNHPDPVAGGAFEYIAFDGGFELHSKAKLDGREVTLTVGKRGK